MKKDNIVQIKSYQFALDIIELVRNFPKKSECLIIGKQLLRSGTSIGANVEEALAAFSKADFIYKMNLALKESRETHYWLRLTRDSNLLKIDLSHYINKVEELEKILTSIIKSSREGQKR